MNYTIEEVDHAISKLTMERPDNCPNEGHVASEIMQVRKIEMMRWREAERQKGEAQEADPETVRVTPEQAEAIMKQVGFTPKRM